MTPQPLNITRIKRQARDLKKATSQQLCQCLEAIAKQHGYATWNGLLAAHPEQRAKARAGAATA